MSLFKLPKRVFKYSRIYQCAIEFYKLVIDSNLGNVKGPQLIREYSKNLATRVCHIPANSLGGVSQSIVYANDCFFLCNTL